MEWLLPLRDLNLTRLADVGGKAARLGAMSQAGFDVPDGFVVTTQACREHIALDEEARPHPPQLDADFVAALASAFGRHFAPGERVAVRSSALDEDTALNSFAGQHATYYFIAAEHLPNAIVDCWLSLWHPQAVAYRSSRGLQAQPMAVIVQRMVDARASGVSFSVSPTQPDKQLSVIESIWGLGAALVDGRVAPDRWQLDRHGRIVEAKIAEKRVMVPSDLTDPTAARLDTVPTDQQLAATLNLAQVKEIWELTDQISVLFNEPVDVEWALDHEGVRILQARPITTALETNVSDGEPLVLFMPAAENFGDPLTPMTVDIVARVMPKIGRFVRGRFYVNFNIAKRFVPLRLDDDKIADVLLLRRPHHEAAIHWPRLMGASLLLAFGYLSNGMFWHRSARVQEDALVSFADLVHQTRENPRLSAPATLRRLLLGRHPFQAISNYVFQLNFSAGRYFLLLGVLNRLIRRWAPNFDVSLVPSLSHGGNDMQSTRMVDAIQNIARIAHDDPNIVAALRDEQAIVRLSEVDLDHPFLQHLSAFLQDFRHRGPKELDFAALRWREDLSPLLTMVRNQLGEENVADQAYARHLSARDQLHQGVTSKWRRRVIDYLIRRIRYYIVLRENTRHYHTMVFDVVRHKLNQLENELIGQRRLECAGDIYFLTWDEALQLQSGALSRVDASQRIRERRIYHQAEGQRKPPSTVNLMTTPSEVAEDDSILHGFCACPGEVTGRVRIVDHPQRAEHLNPGDILVAPFTDPSWTPLFPKLGGIIIDVGSYLSHAGTVAREYQVPCIVGVEDCTSKLADGQLVALNATSGIITIQEDAP